MRRRLFFTGLVVALFLLVQKRFDSGPPPSSNPKTETTEIAEPVSDTTFDKPQDSDQKEQKELSNENLADLVLTRLQEWDDNDDPDLRAQRLRELEELLIGTNALEIVEMLPADYMGYVFAVPSIREKLLANPEASLEWMASHSNTQSQLLTLLQDWSRKDYDAMQQCMGRLPEGEWKQKVLSAAANEAISRDPANAITMASQMQPGSEQTQWLTMSAAEWAKQNPDAAAQWATQMPNGDLRDQLLASVVDGTADNNPEQALDFLERFQLTDAAFHQTVGNMIWSWALKDPADTATWVSQFPEGPTRQLALENVMTVWGNHEPGAATTWVEGLPAGDFQLQAARNLYSVFSDAGQ